MATPEENAAAVAAANGGTEPLTAEAQQIRTLAQTQGTSTQTAPGPIAYTQVFDDGSTLTQNFDGTTRATEATDDPIAFTSTGYGAPNDDFSPFNQPGTTSRVFNTASSSGNPVTPQANILDQYASYTYSLSWYALTAQQYTTMQNSSQINTNSWSLLMQSGGAPAGTNRNKYFNLDYYMDNLVISSAFMTNSPSNVTELEFTVTEPNGITLLQNLNLALRSLNNIPNGSLASVSPYVMVIKFYGYDSQGNLITKLSPSAANSGTSPNSSNAVVVKYIPFNITSFSFKAASRAVEYRIVGTPPGYKYAMSSGLGSVPFPLELTGETVNDVLNGTELTDVTAKETSDRGASNTGSASILSGPQQPSVDSAETQALFSGSSAYSADAGWSA